MDKIKILFLAADPSDSARLRLGQELRDVRGKLQLAKHRDSFLLESRESVRPGDITQAIFDVEPQIVHFCGHGLSTGELCFEDISGKAQIVKAEALSNLFEIVAEQIQCVILNACYSEIQANAIAKYIPFVIGMSQAIGDRAAIAFSVGFYKALGAGRSFETAYKCGCVEIQLEGISEQLTPVLYKKQDMPEIVSTPIKQTSVSNKDLKVEVSLKTDKALYPLTGVPLPETTLPAKHGDLRVTMLGNIGSGKTSYLLGLYDLMQLGLQGFSLSAKDDLDIDIEMACLWEQLCRIQSEDRWPTLDAQGIRRYSFNFNYGLRPLLEFELLDYSGGSMSNLPTDIFSSCFFLFIPGENFRDDMDNNQLRLLSRQAGVHFMHRHLADFARSKNHQDETPLPVAIIISKYDQCYKHVSKEKLVDSIKKMFQTMFLPNSNWLVTIIPISLGKNFSDDRNGASIHPVNLHLPIIFALYCKFRENYLKVNNQLTTYQTELELLRNSNLLIRWLSNDTMRVKDASLQTSQAMAREIQQKMALLEQELAKGSMFYNGKEVEVDI